MVKKIIKSILSVSLVIVALAGCTQVKMPIEDQKKFVNEINNMLADRKPAQEVEEAINQNIKKLDLDYSSDVVNAYIFSLYQENSYMISKVGIGQGELAELSKKKNIDITDKRNISKIENGLVKGLLEELDKRHLLLKKEGENYYVTVDIDYVLSKYSNYMKDDLKAFTQFRQREEKTPIFNADNETFNIPEIADRIVTIEKELPKWKESQFKENWVAQQEYYYNILFSLNHDFFKDGDRFNSAVKVKFEEAIKKHVDTQFAKDIQAYLEVIEKAQGKMDDSVISYVTDTLKEKFPHSQAPQLNTDIPVNTENPQIDTEPKE